MKLLKITAGFIIVIVIISAVVVGFGLTKINGIVKDLIEGTGSSTLMTQVKVGAVDIKLTEGSGAVNGLTIANPKGYSNAKLLSIGSAGLQIDLNSLTNKVKVIKSVNVSGVKLLAEQKNIKDTNIQALINNLKSTSSGSSSTSSNETSPATDVRLMIESLSFGESVIDLTTEQYGSKTITLPAYSQKNIGNKSKGLTPEQLSEAIVSSLLNKVEKAVKRSIREAAKDKVESKLKDKLTEKIGDKISTDDIDKLKQLFK